MSRWPDITKLTESEKDTLLLKCFAVIDRLEERLKKVEDQLSKNSNNSSKPPSNDTGSRTKSQRKQSGKKTGGQKGHKGNGLKMSDVPDHTVIHKAVSCGCCKRSLENEFAHGYEKRQVFDIPTKNTRYISNTKRC